MSSPVTSRLDVLPPRRNQSFQAAETKADSDQTAVGKSIVSVLIRRSQEHLHMTANKDRKIPTAMQAALELAAGVRCGHAAWKPQHQDRFDDHNQHFSLSLDEAVPVVLNAAAAETPLACTGAQTLFTRMARARFYLCHLMK